MPTINIGANKTTVKQISLYKIEEDTEPRLVLRAKKIGMYLGGALLIVFALVLGGAAAAIEGWAAIALALVGALVLLGGVALIRKGMRNKDRIIFDRTTETVSFDMTRAQDNLTVPFREIDRIELRLEDRSEFEKRCIMYLVDIVKKDGKALKVDEATNRKQMTELAAKAAAVCRVPFRDLVMTEVAA